MKKLIEFYPCGYRGGDRFHRSFADTRAAIERGDALIRTESMAHLSFNLNNLGYTIVMVGADGTRTKIFPKMTAPNGRKLDVGHNLTKMLINGLFDPIIK